jgi:cephalosporin hydroxylase
MNYLRSFFRHSKRTLFGHDVQQTGAAIYVLEQFLKAHKPDCIIELGTGNGVLSKFFELYSILSKEVVIFKSGDISQRYSTLDTCYWEGDAYSDKSINDMCNIMHDSTKPFLYIDALDPKSNLVNLYSPFLKAGTIVAAHDAILKDNAYFKWGFTENEINWERLERFGPYYDMSREFDTRTLYMRVKENL